MKVFLIAGEPSGDRLGAALMAGLRQLAPEVQFVGVGGPEMARMGLESLFDMSELSIMGLAEILPKYRALMRRINQTVEAVLDEAPDVLITIDSPDFCFRVAKKVKAARPIRTVHYVAPSVWAWRPKRAEHMAGFIDHVLALLPFEPPLMEAAGMACDFVGHPVVAEPVASAAEAESFRQDCGIGGAPFVLVLPGSRKAEVARLSDVFGAALREVVARRPDLRVVVPAAASVAEDVCAAVSDWPGDPVVLDPRDDSGTVARKRAAFRAANVALAASGTVSLELAASATPMVIGYRVNWLTFQIVKAIALIDTVTLVNLVSDSRVVPEYLGPECTAPAIADGLDSVLAQPGRQMAAMDLTMERLGRGGEAPGLRAARAVLDRM